MRHGFTVFIATTGLLAGLFAARCLHRDDGHVEWLGQCHAHQTHSHGAGHDHVALGKAGPSHATTHLQTDLDTTVRRAGAKTPVIVISAMAECVVTNASHLPTAVEARQSKWPPPPGERLLALKSFLL